MFSTEATIWAVSWIIGVVACYLIRTRNKRLKSSNISALNAFSPASFNCRTCLKAKRATCGMKEKCSYVVFVNMVIVIESATKTIDVCCALLTNKILIDVLKDANDRGVRVRIITDHSLCTSGVNGRDGYLELTNAGIPMLRAFQDGIMHHKFILLDNKYLLLGSMNWTMQGFFGNYENMEFTNDREAIRAFSKEFEYLFGHVNDFPLKRKVAPIS